MTSKTLTHEQLSAVTIVRNEQTGELFFIVQSASDPTVTYQVRYNRHFNRYSCQCKGNQNGYVCWHMRAALEVGREYAENKRAEAEAARQLELRAAQARAEREHLMTVKPYQHTEAEIQRDQKRYAPRPFCLLR